MTQWCNVKIPVSAYYAETLSLLTSNAEQIRANETRLINDSAHYELPLSNWDIVGKLLSQNRIKSKIHTYPIDLRQLFSLNNVSFPNSDLNGFCNTKVEIPKQINAQIKAQSLMCIITSTEFERTFFCLFASPLPPARPPWSQARCWLCDCAKSPDYRSWNPIPWKVSTRRYTRPFFQLVCLNANSSPFWNEERARNVSIFSRWWSLIKTRFNQSINIRIII